MDRFYSSALNGMDAMRAWQPAIGRLAGLTLLLLVIPAAGGGCSSFWKKDPEKAEQERLEALLKAPAPPQFIRDAAAPYGLRYGKIQSFGIVNNLLNTGGSEPPSMQRDMILAELASRNIEKPNQFIDAKHTAIVMVETVLPPGVRRGDPLDLIVKYSSRPDVNSDRATSLRNGWLMPARLAYTEVINGTPRTSEVLALGTGPVIVKGAHEATDDPAALLEGRIIGGGVAQKDGRLDLRIRPEYRHVKTAKLLQDVINRRFYLADHSGRRGIANAREDDLIDVEAPERYRHNVHRLMAVIGALGTESDLAKTHQRIVNLGNQLMEPTAAQDAALQLEGIGEEAIPTLLKGAQSANAEIRFYSAEALAYLDHSDCVAPLVELARDQPAFRFPIFLALSGMKGRVAGEGLQSLLNEQSVETRFGAFDAIRKRADRSTWIQGRALGEIGNLYEIPSRGGSLVAVSMRRSPDIVTFGGEIPIVLNGNVMCGTGVLIVPSEGGGLQISRFLPGRPDAQVTVPASVKGVCQGIVQVGGDYGDIVESLRLLKNQNAYEAQLAIDVLPQPLREFHREPESGTSLDTTGLPPTPIQPPPPVEEPKPWYNPWGWFG
jgi:flagellar basal body P-ring protein FlgI